MLSGKAALLYQKDAVARILLHCYPFEPDNHSGAFAANAVVVSGSEDIGIPQALAAQHRAALSAV